MNALLWFVVSVLSMWLALVWAFTSVMHAKAILDRGEAIHWVFKAPLLVLGIIGVVADVAFNLSAGTVIYREWPQELLFTSRCARHKEKNDWRGRKARWWCAEMNKFDPGHCG